MRQQAQSLFLQHELFATRERCGVLLLVSEFEREIVILPDTGVSAQLPQTTFEAVIDSMRGPLARGQLAQGFEIGLATLARRGPERREARRVIAGRNVKSEIR